MLFVDCRYLAVQFKKYKTRNSVFVFQMCNTELYIESTARNVHGKWDQCNNGSFLTIKSDCDWYLQTEHLKYSWWFNVWKNKKKMKNNVLFNLLDFRSIFFVFSSNTENRICVKLVQMLPKAKVCTALLGVALDVAFTWLLLFRLLLTVFHQWTCL